MKAGEQCAVVESVKTASDVYSPVSGEVAEVNKALEDNPGLANEDPFGQGWFFRVKLGAPEELDGLLSAEAYAAQIS